MIDVVERVSICFTLYFVDTCLLYLCLSLNIFKQLRMSYSRLVLIDQCLAIQKTFRRK